MNIRLCSLAECDRKHKGRGFCELHLQRMKRTGTTDDPPKLTLAERFWAMVDRRGADECWPWTGALNEHGYGVMRPEGRRSGPTIKAHRVSLMLTGVDVDGWNVLHSCDNPPCVNPAHLRTGTKLENTADALARNRLVRGSAVVTAKLIEPDVIEIRRLARGGARQKDIAEQFGVSRSHISMIANRKNWRHVA